MLGGISPREIMRLSVWEYSIMVAAWREAHEPPKPGSKAPSDDKFEQMTRRLAGDLIG